VAKGDHIFIPLSTVLSHHGIDLGDGHVVHWWSGEEGKKRPLNYLTRKAAANISHTTMDQFLEGATFKVREYDSCFEPDVVVERALSRVGEGGYDLLSNNCEHFATWCKTGCEVSAQVQTARRQAVAIGTKATTKPIVKVATTCSTKVGAKALARAATPWLFVADALQLATEFVATTHGGMEPKSAETVGRSVGGLGSVGIGAAVGGPLGAAVGLAIWGFGELIGGLVG